MKLPKYSTANPELRIVYGPPGCGKNTLIRFQRLDNSFTTYIDYDLFIQEGGEDLVKVQKAIKARTHILCQTAGKDVNYFDEWLEKLRKVGYKIVLYTVMTPGYCLKEREQRNEYCSKKLSLAENQITDYWTSSYTNLLQIIEKVDTIFMFSNINIIHQLRFIDKERALKITNHLLKRNQILTEPISSTTFRNSHFPGTYRCPFCYSPENIIKHEEYCKSKKNIVHVNRVIKRQEEQNLTAEYYSAELRSKYIVM